MKGSVKLPVFIDDARKLVNTTQLRAKYLGASYEAEYCQWQTLHGLGSLMETASLIITPNAYLEGKLLASYPPDPIGDFDVTRATTATRVNSAGLVELVPYNLLSYSEQFNNGYWSTYQSNITANSTIAPNGTTTADTLTQSGAGGGSVYLSSLTYTGGAFTISCYVKKGTNNTFIMDSNPSSGYFGASFNLDTEVITFFGVTTNANIENLNNTWYRCSVTANASGSAYVAFGQNASVGSTLFIWGAQVNEGTIKSYQKTETRLNIPRLDYSNGTCPSILVEPQRTNLLTYSSSFDNGSWSAIDTTITANTTASPNGNTDADTMAITSSTSRIFQMVTLGAGTYTASIYVKSLSGTPTIQLRMVVDGVDITQSIPTTTDWVRHDFTFTAALAVSFFVIRGESGTGSVAIWGAQLEAGSYATSYIPTTSASVTRNADVISKTGISSLIGQTEGTLFVETKFTNVDSFSSYIGLTSGAFTNSIIIGKEAGVTPNKLILYIAANGSAILNNTTTALSSDYVKCAIAYKSGDWAAYVNGTLVASGTSTFSFSSSLDVFGIGANNGSLSQTFDKTQTKAAALWKTRLTNAQLATLTTI